MQRAARACASRNSVDATPTSQDSSSVSSSSYNASSILVWRPNRAESWPPSSSRVADKPALRRASQPPCDGAAASDFGRSALSLLRKLNILKESEVSKQPGRARVRVRQIWRALPSATSRDSNRVSRNDRRLARSMSKNPTVSVEFPNPVHAPTCPLMTQRSAALAALVFAILCSAPLEAKVQEHTLGQRHEDHGEGRPPRAGGGVDGLVPGRQHGRGQRHHRGRARARAHDVQGHEAMCRRRILAHHRARRRARQRIHQQGHHRLSPAAAQVAAAAGVAARGRPHGESGVVARKSSRGRSKW